MRKFANLVLWTLVAMIIPAVALAADGEAGMGRGIGAGLAVGLAGLGCGLGQGLTASNTTAGIARNPGKNQCCRFQSPCDQASGYCPGGPGGPGLRKPGYFQ